MKRLLIINFCLLVALIVLVSYDHTTVMREVKQPEPEVFDYKMNLMNHDGCYDITIVDKYDHVHIIYPDSLEEFIIRDNL